MPVAPIRALSLDGSLIANLARSMGKLTLSDGSDGKQLFSAKVGKSISKRATKVEFSEEKYELFIYTPGAKFTFDLATKSILASPAEEEEHFDDDDSVIAGFRIEVVSLGCKLKPKKDDIVRIHYEGTLASTGEKFDSSRDHKTPFKMKVGAGETIRAWEEGILQICLGERVKLYVKSEYAYGGKSKQIGGCEIPAHSDLIFDIEILRINDKKPLKKQEVETFRKSLEEWASGKLKKYDEDEAFRAKRDARHHDRVNYKAWLDKEVQSSVAEAFECLKIGESRRGAWK